MKIFVILCAIVIFAVAVFGQPINLEEVDELGDSHHLGKYPGYFLIFSINIIILLLFHIFFVHKIVHTEHQMLKVSK